MRMFKMLNIIGMPPKKFFYTYIKFTHAIICPNKVQIEDYTMLVINI